MTFTQAFQLVPENPKELVSRRRITLAVVMVAIALLIPVTGSFYYMSVVTMVFFWIVLTQSWNIISGYTGYLSFGHSVFVGLGAFTTAYLVTATSTHWVAALLISGILGLLFAILVGLPVLRLAGIYFAIGMLVLSEVAKLAAEDPLSPITQGVRGIIIIGGPSRTVLYYTMGVLAVLSVVTMYYVVNTRIGLYLMAIREHDTAAESVGVNTTFWKLFAFCLSAVYISVAGGIYAMWLTYIDPSVVFHLEFNVQMIFMTVIGGMGTIAGPLFGALLFGLFKESVTVYALELQQAITGLALVLFIYYRPDGLYGIYQDRHELPEKVPRSLSELVEILRARLPYLK